VRNAIAEVLARRQDDTGVRLLWGTANLFSHPRYMAGAATNPDPEVFAYAAATVKHCMDVTRRLGGENYVLWGGREGYDTLLNTDLGRELDQMGRFLNLVVEYKHQYDFDAATVYGFLKRYGLEHEVKLNLEANHAQLAGHSFEHETATASALGILGSLDVNRGDPLIGWDTDQFPNSVQDTALALYYVLKSSGPGSGGLNFDAKIRRQSIDPEDLVHAHVGGIDLCAHALPITAAMIEDGRDDRGRPARRPSLAALRRLGHRTRTRAGCRAAHAGTDRRRRRRARSRPEAALRPAGVPGEPAPSLPVARRPGTPFGSRVFQGHISGTSRWPASP
jgi:xylose isomerase